MRWAVDRKTTDQVCVRPGCWDEQASWRWDSISDQRGKRVEARHHGQADAVGQNAEEYWSCWRYVCTWTFVAIKSRRREMLLELLLLGELDAPEPGVAWATSCD